MNWGQLIAFSILGIFLGTLLFFFIKEYIRVNNNKLNNYKNIFLWGITLGSFLLFEYLLGFKSTDNNLYFSITIIFIPIITLLINPSFTISAVIGSLIGIVLKTSSWSELNSYIPFIQISIAAALSLMLAFTTKILSKKYGSQILVGGLVIIVTWLLVSIIVIPAAGETAEGMLNSFYNLLLLSISYSVYSVIIYGIENIYSSYNKLEVFDNVDKTSFYKLSKSIDEISNTIQKNKYQFGLIMTFDFKNVSKSSLATQLKKLRKDILEKYPDTIFFKTNGNHYSLFIPLDEEYLLLKKFRETNLRIQKDMGYLTELQNILTISSSVKGYCAIYGIDSSDLNDLIYKTHELIKNISNKKLSSTLIFFDYKRKRSALYDRSLSFRLPETITNKNIVFIRSVYESNIYFYSKQNIEKADNDKEIIERYLSLKAIKSFDHFDNSKLVINYSTKHLSSKSFNKTKFVDKISETISPNKIIIGLDPEAPNKNLELITKWLRTKGFEIAALNAEKASERFISAIEPEYFLLEKQEFSIENFLSPNKDFEEKIIAKAKRL